MMLEPGLDVALSTGTARSVPRFQQMPTFKDPKADHEWYLTTGEAAEYIRYSVRQFRRLVDKHSIPAFGPELNRFRFADLDSFMKNPNAFKVERAIHRRAGGFTPVQL